MGCCYLNIVSHYYNLLHNEMIPPFDITHLEYPVGGEVAADSSVLIRGVPRVEHY